MSLNLKNTFKSIALGGMVATTPMVANDAQTSELSESVTKASTHQVPISRAAYTASQELGVVGVAIVKTNDTERSPEKLKAVIEWLLIKQGIEKYHVVTDQADEGTTNFRVFVDGQSKQYTFASIKEGIRIAKIDVDNSIRAARHDTIISRNRN